MNTGVSAWPRKHLHRGLLIALPLILVGLRGYGISPPQRPPATTDENYSMQLCSRSSSWYLYCYTVRCTATTEVGGVTIEAPSRLRRPAMYLQCENAGNVMRCAAVLYIESRSLLLSLFPGPPWLYQYPGVYFPELASIRHGLYKLPFCSTYWSTM